MVNTKKLKAAMIIADVSAQDLADACGWKTVATAYRKINGLAEFTVPEMQNAKGLMHLSADETEEIFLCPPMS